MNKKLMMLLVATVGAGSQIQTNGGGGWGGFGGGLATGVILTSAVNSGNNRYVSPEESDRRAQNDSGRRVERQIKDIDRKISRLNTDIKRIDRNKNLSEDQRAQQAAAKEKQISKLEDQQRDLQDSLR